MLVSCYLYEFLYFTVCIYLYFGMKFLIDILKMVSFFFKSSFVDVQKTKLTYFKYTCYAPVIAIPGFLGTGDSRDIAGPKCRDLTFDESRQCRRCAGFFYFPPKCQFKPYS